MMTNANGHLTIVRNGRAVPLQRLNDATYYAALRVYGVGEAVAQGLTANLITLSTKGK